MDISSIALKGLEQAWSQLDAAASAIAGAGSSDNGAPTDTVSLSEEMVALMSAKILHSANIAALKTADQIRQNLFNVMA